MEATRLKRVNHSFESFWTAETLLNLAQRRVRETAEQATLLRKKMKAAKKEFKLAKKTARLAKKKLAMSRQSFEKTKVRTEKKAAKGHSVVPKVKVKQADMPTGAVAAQQTVRKPAFPKPAATQAATKPCAARAQASSGRLPFRIRRPRGACRCQPDSWRHPPSPRPNPGSPRPAFPKKQGMVSSPTPNRRLMGCSWPPALLPASKKWNGPSGLATERDRYNETVEEDLGGRRVGRRPDRKRLGAIERPAAPASAPKTWADTLAFKGDLRYRYETIDDDSKKDANGDDIHARAQPHPGAARRGGQVSTTS